MCLLCPFPIVKAISVRLQYFKDETKQSICLGNKKSTLVCPFFGEQGLSSSSSLDLPFSPTPRPFPMPLCPAPHGACLCVCACVCDGEPPCTPTVCLSVSYPGQDGHSLEPWGPGAEIGRAQSRSPRPPQTLCVSPTGHRSGSQVFRNISPLTGATDLQGGARAQSMLNGQQRLRPGSFR